MLEGQGKGSGSMMGMFSSGSDENVQMGGNDNTTQGKLKTTELYTWRENGFCGCHVLWKTGRPGALHPSSPVFQWPKATSVYKDSFSSFKLKGMVAVSPKGFPASWLWGSGLTAYVEAEHFWQHLSSLLTPPLFTVTRAHECYCLIIPTQ